MSVLSANVGVTHGDKNLVRTFDSVNEALKHDIRQDPIYTPDWPSIDSRPIPEWFDQSKIGVRKVYNFYKF